MPTTSPAKKSDKQQKSDLKVVDRDEEGGTITVDILGEKFLCITDVNAYLQYMITTGEAKFLRKFFLSVLTFPDADAMSDNELAAARMREEDRFDNCLGSQRHFTFERLFRLVNDFMEAVGNETPDSPDD